MTDTIRAWIKARRRETLLLAAAALLFLAGRWTAPERGPSHPAPTAPEAHAATVWTCSMHPEVRLPEKGKCPKCGMDLIPETTGDTGPADVVTLSPATVRRIGLETALAERRAASAILRLSGTLDFDESRLRTITAWFPGRLTRLFVDYTGLPVRAGDHMVEIYSPELYAAQQEYLSARRAAQSAKGGTTGAFSRDDATALEAAAREKLSRLGLQAAQIDALVAAGKPSATMELQSPLGGVVTEKLVKPGMYVETGTPLYTVADLSRLWLRLFAYESDLAWLRPGQGVECVTEAYGGAAFPGRISFIDPVVNGATRAVGVRVVVENPDGRLKPGMFVRATVRVPVDGAGAPVPPAPGGQYTCPMHPEEVRETAGACTVCGMPLVPIAMPEHGTGAAGGNPLVIPVTAPLLTGNRAMVYVELPDGGFAGREVVLGPRLGDEYLVRDGLTEGERVVVRGNFMLDASQQIRGRPSLMNTPAAPVMQGQPAEPVAQATGAARPEASAPMAFRADVPATFRARTEAVLAAVTSAMAALARDDDAAAQRSAKALSAALGQLDMATLPHPAHMAWMELWPMLRDVAGRFEAAPDMTARRALIADLTAATGRILPFGDPAGGELYLYHCPMARDGEGGTWLDTATAVNNPYYGAAMPHCGEQLRVLRAKATP